MMYGFQALGLDLDDTLHDYRSASGKAMGAVFSYLEEEHGLDEQDLKLSYDSILADHVREGFASGCSSEEYRRERFEKLLRKFSIIGSREIDDMLNIYQETLDRSMALNCGAQDLLRAAKNAGLAVLVITDGPEDAQVRALNALGVSGLVDHLITAGAERVDKQNGLLSRALEIAACAPKEMLYIGDSYERDVIPAIRCGIDVYYYSNRGRAQGDLPLKALGSLTEAVTIIEEAARDQQQAMIA